MKHLLDQIISNSTTKKIPKEQYPHRVYDLLKKYNFNPDSLKYIHITGSKGKGSLAYNTFLLLKAQGSQVGLFTSPHIFDVSERFVTNQGAISETTLSEYIQKYHKMFQQEELHFFEVCLFLALVYFLDQKCEYVVLEVGVGGRFDPTNFCQPLLALIGHVSLEHRDFLGNTIQEIAYDKAGIIKKNTPTLSVTQESIVKETFQQEGDVIFFEDLIQINHYQQQKNGVQVFDLTISGNQKVDYIVLKRLGYAHVVNFCLAVAGIKILFPNYDNQWIYQVAQDTFTCRMELIDSQTILDTAHNGVSFENLLRTIKSLQWKSVVCYITILKGKELQDIADVLLKYRDIIQRIEFFEFDTNTKRNSDALGLYQIVKDQIPSFYFSSIEELSWDSDLSKFFAGSFYCIPQIKNWIQYQNTNKNAPLE